MVHIPDRKAFDAYIDDAIQTAVIAADRVVLERSEGNPEILALLTIGVTREFIKKLMLVMEIDFRTVKTMCELPTGLFPWHDPNNQQKT